MSDDEVSTDGRVSVCDGHMPIRVDQSGAVLFASREALLDALAQMRNGDVALVGYVDVELDEIRCLTAADLAAIRDIAHLLARVDALEAETERGQQAFADLTLASVERINALEAEVARLREALRRSMPAATSVGQGEDWTTREVQPGRVS